jgi:NADH-quinone oxidoreductase subunit A
MTSGSHLWMLALYFGAILALVALMIGLSAILGERHISAPTLQPYESGMLPVDSARVRFPSQFYLVAMFFVIFDLEAVFIYAWAVAARELGWAGYIELLVFVVVLGAAVAYLWRVGALDWGPRHRAARYAGRSGGR